MLIGVGFVHADIIHFSKLEKEKTNFSFKKDLFSPQPGVGTPALSREEKRAIQNRFENEKPEKSPEKEIQESVSFEGFIEKNEKILALISVNGDFFVVSEGDVILDKLKIIRIDKEKITLELDNQRIEIQLKGESHD